MGICLLIVNDDFRCRDIASQVLQHCNYEVLHTGRLMDALNAISEKRDTLNSVLVTNVHRLGEKGSQILNQIRGQLNFEIIYMTPDDKIVEWKRGEEISTSAYVVNVLNIEDINSLWESALAKGKAVNQEETSTQMAIEVHDDQVTDASRENPPSVSDGSRTHQKRKRKEPKELTEQSQGSGDDQPVEKKLRVVWTKEMHRKFLEAIETLGPDKTFPKKIVELMNEPGLTRENVASHLQKYRMCLKKNQEEAANSNNGMNPCFSSFQPFGYPFQQGSCGIFSMPSLGLSRPFTGPPPSFPCNDPRGLVHMQSKHFTRYPASTSFRIYGDKTKNILLSTEDGSSSSNVSMPSNSEIVESFIGLRFTTDGKSLEFGQPSVSGNNEIQKEMFSSVGTPGTEIQDHSNPLASASYSPEPPNTLSQNGSRQNEVSDYSPSIFGDCIFEQEPFLALLDSSVEENAAHCALVLPIDSTFQQNHDPLPYPCNSENPTEFLSPSTPGSHISQKQSWPSFLEVPTSWNSSTTLPPLYNPGNVSSLQYPTVLSSGVSMDEIAAPSLSIFTPQQQISFPSLGTSGNVTSVQESSTSTPYQIPMQESSMPLIPSIQDEFDNFQPVDDINSFLNETAECSNPQLFWEGIFDYAHHNHVD